VKRPPLHELRGDLIRAMLSASHQVKRPASTLECWDTNLSPFDAVKVAEEHLTLRNLLRLWRYRVSSRWWTRFGRGRDW
jgi:hypothetical protein